MSEEGLQQQMAMSLIKQRRLLLYEKRLKERLGWIEERLTVLATDMEPGSLHQQRAKCGARCRCNDGRGHGPYWYIYKSTDAGLVKRYVRPTQLPRLRRRLRNYQEYLALGREVHTIQEYLDVGVVTDSLKITAEFLRMLKANAG